MGVAMSSITHAPARRSLGIVLADILSDEAITAMMGGFAGRLRPRGGLDDSFIIPVHPHELDQASRLRAAPWLSLPADEVEGGDAPMLSAEGARRVLRALMAALSDSAVADLTAPYVDVLTVAAPVALPRARNLPVPALTH